MRLRLRPEPVGREFRDSTVPVDWAKAFTQTGPLHVEIGCGAGGYALEFCRRDPTVRYIAFEWRQKFAREVAHRADKHGIANLKVIEGDAKSLWLKLFVPASIDVLHLQFPDPWWKRAQQKRAILHTQFISLLLSRLKPGGTFDFRTDVEARAREGLSLLESAGLKNPLGPGQFRPREEDEVASTRERRYLVSGEPVYRATLTLP
jgi:tRNA (guanine-N7-)-methyltransferase